MAALCSGPALARPPVDKYHAQGTGPVSQGEGGLHRHPLHALRKPGLRQLGAQRTTAGGGQRVVFAREARNLYEAITAENAVRNAVAEQQGTPRARLGGTLQNDILKEYQAQKEYVFPPRPSLRLVTDTIAKWRDIGGCG